MKRERDIAERGEEGGGEERKRETEGRREREM